MTVRKLPRFAKLLAIAAVTASVVGFTATPAAAVDDSRNVYTYGQCGLATFVDYGPGAAGGGNNDDYVRIADLCSDGHGVKAYAWINGYYLGSGYNGNGYGSAVIWDPFGNVLPGQKIGLKVCLVDGNNDPTPFRCLSGEWTSVDG
jgi:hypothetical protein